MRCAEERAVMRQVRRGEIPTFSYVCLSSLFLTLLYSCAQRRPILTDHSWPRMWDRHLHWKRYVHPPPPPYIHTVSCAIDGH